MQMGELNGIVTAIMKSSADTQASCATLLATNGFYFSAMKSVSTSFQAFPRVLKDLQVRVSAMPARI